MVTMSQFQSCQSSKREVNYVTKTVYQVPPIYFYNFPTLRDSITIPLDAEGKRIKDNDTEVVSVVVPYWYIQQLAEFKLRYEETIKQYDHYKQIKLEYIKE